MGPGAPLLIRLVPALHACTQDIPCRSLPVCSPSVCVYVCVDEAKILNQSCSTQCLHSKFESGLPRGPPQDLCATPLWQLAVNVAGIFALMLCSKLLLVNSRAALIPGSTPRCAHIGITVSLACGFTTPGAPHNRSMPRLCPLPSAQSPYAWPYQHASLPTACWMCSTLFISCNSHVLMGPVLFPFRYAGCWRWVEAEGQDHYLKVDSSDSTAEMACEQVLQWLKQITGLHSSHPT